MTDYEVIKSRIRDELEGYRVQLQTELARVEDALRSFATDGDQPSAPTPAKTTKRKRMSAAARAAVSARMRKYWADRKRKKTVK